MLRKAFLLRQARLTGVDPMVRVPACERSRSAAVRLEKEGQFPQKQTDVNGSWTFKAKKNN